MLVLDTNIWVYAFTGENSTAMRLVERVVSQNARTVVDTYLYWEVINALGSSRLSREDIDRAQDQFAQFIWGDNPTVGNEVDDDLIEQFRDRPETAGIDMVRGRTHNEMLGEICGIQAKDAPIASLAFEFRDENPTVYTNDGQFASFVPANYNLPAIEMEYVATEAREAEPNFFGQHLPGT